LQNKTALAQKRVQSKYKITLSALFIKYFSEIRQKAVRYSLLTVSCISLKIS